MFDECAGNFSHKRLRAVFWLLAVIAFFAAVRWFYITRINGASECRAHWMSGKYGVMVHWLYADPVNVDEVTDAFDLEGFMSDFDRTGAEWLIFPIGQNRGAYAAPSETLRRLAGDKVGLPRRDLVGEIAKAVHGRGKRFIAYLPTEVRGNPVRKLLKWDEQDPRRTEFQKVWTDVIREWSVRYGVLIDGWWLDGYYGKGDFHDAWPEPLDEALWADALRAGNPRAAVAVNSGILEVKHEPEWHIARLTPRAKTLPDYLAGELNYIKDGKCYISPWEDTYWMPESAFAKGTKVLNHVLFAIDGAWGMYWPWAKGMKPPFLETRLEMTDASALQAMESSGETPEPVFSRECLQRFVRDFTAIGGAVTINLGIDRKGRMNPKSLSIIR